MFRRWNTVNRYELQPLCERKTPPPRDTSMPALVFTAIALAARGAPHRPQLCSTLRRAAQPTMLHATDLSLLDVSAVAAHAQVLINAQVASLATSLHRLQTSGIYSHAASSPFCVRSERCSASDARRCASASARRQSCCRARIRATQRRYDLYSARRRRASRSAHRQLSAWPDGRLAPAAIV